MSTNRDELGDLLPRLSEEAAGKVLHFARAELAREAAGEDTEGDDYLDGIAADPERLARFRAAIDVGMAQSERGEGRPASEVFAELRLRTAAMRGGRA